MEDSAKRELLEETGLAAKKLTCVGVVRQYQEENKSTFIHFVFACSDYGGKVTNREPEKCEGWEWYPIEKLPSPILEGHKYGIEMFLKKEKGLFWDVTS